MCRTIAPLVICSHEKVRSPARPGHPRSQRELSSARRQEADTGFVVLLPLAYAVALALHGREIRAARPLAAHQHICIVARRLYAGQLVARSALLRARGSPRDGTSGRAVAVANAIGRGRRRGCRRQVARAWQTGTPAVSSARARAGRRELGGAERAVGSSKLGQHGGQRCECGCRGAHRGRAGGHSAAAPAPPEGRPSVVRQTSRAVVPARPAALASWLCLLLLPSCSSACWAPCPGRCSLLRRRRAEVWPSRAPPTWRAGLEEEHRLARTARK